MSPIPKSKEELEKLIADNIEENQHLEYKSSEALQATDSKKKEIAKDVSAMANSAGGLIIYGIKEFDEKDKRHLPQEISPVDRSQYSKEWLEQVINGNISPRIDGIIVHPIPLDKTNETVYVIEIPQSTTAHQNTADGRYYRRYNFETLVMMDYEIRDVMNRVKNPLIEIDFEIHKKTIPIQKSLFQIRTLDKSKEEPEFKTNYTLKIVTHNKGSVYAKYINYYLFLPEDIVDTNKANLLARNKDGLIIFEGDNTYRDVIDIVPGFPGRNKKYGPSRFDPVLPGMIGRPETVLLVENPVLDDRVITWIVHADNAQQNKGIIKLSEIPVFDKCQ